MRTSGSVRLRGAMRMTVAMRSRDGSAPRGSTLQSCGSMPFGTTSTSPARGTAAAMRRAATSLTALRVTPHLLQRTSPSDSPNPGRASGPQTLCTVTSVGMPRRVAARTAPQAKGDTTPACTCTTSTGWRSSRRPDLGDGARMDGELERQVRRDAMDRQPVDDVVAREHVGMAGRGRDDPHVVAVRRLASGEGPHLRLDAARARGVAVADVGDPHSRRPYATMRPMSRTPRTLVFVHAHPDDEALLTAGTMARATSEGHRVVLVVATDGAAGLTSQEFQDDLAGTRLAEVEASARALGVARTVTLGYPDSGLHGDVPGGFAQVGRFTIAKRIAGDLRRGGRRRPRRLRPVRRLRAPRPRPGAPLGAHGGGPVRTRRPGCSRRPCPASPSRAPRISPPRCGSRPPSSRPSEFDTAWTPRADITHRVDVRAHLAAKDASLRAHSSQAAADGTTRTLAVLTRLPRPLQALILGTEYYVAVPASQAARASSTAVGLS